MNDFIRFFVSLSFFTILSFQVSAEDNDPNLEPNEHPLHETEAGLNMTGFNGGDGGKEHPGKDHSDPPKETPKPNK